MNTKRRYSFAVVILSSLALIIGCTGSAPGRTGTFVRAPTGTSEIASSQPQIQPTQVQTALPGTSSTAEVPVSSVAPVPTPIPSPTPTLYPTPTLTPTAPPLTPGARLIIECVFFDGLAVGSEADEYVQILNQGDAAVDLIGWRLQDVSDGSPDFTFPTYELPPLASVRVYTDEMHPESGGFSFQRKSAVWGNSSPDTAGLFGPDGLLVSTKSYPPGC